MNHAVNKDAHFTKTADKKKPISADLFALFLSLRASSRRLLDPLNKQQ